MLLALLQEPLGRREALERKLISLLLSRQSLRLHARRCPLCRQALRQQRRLRRVLRLQHRRPRRRLLRRLAAPHVRLLPRQASDAVDVPHLRLQVGLQQGPAHSFPHCLLTVMMYTLAASCTPAWPLVP